MIYDKIIKTKVIIFKAEDWVNNHAINIAEFLYLLKVLRSAISNHHHLTPAENVGIMYSSSETESTAILKLHCVYTSSLLNLCLKKTTIFYRYPRTAFHFVFQMIYDKIIKQKVIIFKAEDWVNNHAKIIAVFLHLIKVMRSAISSHYCLMLPEKWS